MLLEFRSKITNIATYTKRDATSAIKDACRNPVLVSRSLITPFRSSLVAHFVQTVLIHKPTDIKTKTVPAVVKLLITAGTE